MVWQEHTLAAAEAMAEIKKIPLRTFAEDDRIDLEALIKNQFLARWNGFFSATQVVEPRSNMKGQLS
jgi:hypothetical protein